MTLQGTNVGTTRTGAQVVADMLSVWDTEAVFHIPGEGILPIVNELAVRHERIKLITCRQEGGMGFMADCYGRLKHKPGICLAARAPGAMNTCLAIFTAYNDSVPLIMLIGQGSMNNMEREAYLNSDFLATFGPMTKWTAQVDDASRIPEMMSRAYHMAMTGRPGPVVLVLPEEALYGKTDMADVEQPRLPILYPSQQDIDELTVRLKESSRPMLLVGGTIWHEENRLDLEHFAERFKIPVVTAYRRRDFMDNRHPCYVGELGLGNNPKLIERIQSSDLVIALGVKLGELNTIGKGVFQGYTLFDIPKPEQTLVHIHPGISELNRVFQADLTINAESGMAAKALNNIEVSDFEAAEDWCADSRKDYEAFCEVGGEPKGTVDFKAILKWMRNRVAEDSILTVGAGSYSIWPQRYFPHFRTGTQVGPKSGAMGWGLPAAVCAAVLNPEKTVIALAGDGCFLMNGEELATAVKYQLQVICIVVNNEKYGAIEQGQIREFGQAVGTDLASPDFCAYANAFGAQGLKVTCTEEFAPAFDKALEYEGPSLIELVVGGMTKP